MANVEVATMQKRLKSYSEDFSAGLKRAPTHIALSFERFESSKCMEQFATVACSQVRHIHAAWRVDAIDRLKYAQSVQRAQKHLRCQINVVCQPIDLDAGG